MLHEGAVAAEAAVVVAEAEVQATAAEADVMIEELEEVEVPCI